MTYKQSALVSCQFTFVDGMSSGKLFINITYTPR